MEKAEAILKGGPKESSSLPSCWCHHFCDEYEPWEEWQLTQDCQQYFRYHQLLSLFLLVISPSLYPLSMGIPIFLLPFFHPFHFCSLFHERHCCDPACASDQDVRPYGYPEQPFSCSWGLFQSVYSFWKLVSEVWQHSFESLMGCEHSKVNWDDCPCLLPGNVLPILGVLLWKRALCHKASISVEWGHLEETNR